MSQVVKDLIGGAVRRAFEREQFFHVSDVEIAYAPTANFSALYELLESFHGVVQRNFSAPMEQIEIEVIGVEALETAFAGVNGSAAGGVVGEDFAD